MRLCSRLTLLASLLSASLAPRAALADGDAQAEGERLAREGQAALDAKDWATAADRFARAEARVHVPVLLGLGRAHAGMGDLLLARRTYERALAEAAASAPTPALRVTLEEIRRELDQLGLRIPTITIALAGAAPSELRLDGAALPLSTLGQKVPVNPGKHLVHARAAGPSGSAVTVTVTVDEGKHETVTLELGASEPAPSVARPPPSPPPRVAPAPTTPAPTAPPPLVDPGAGQRKVAYVTFGLGGVGLLLGTITGIVAVNRHAELDRLCPEGRCPVSAIPKLDSYHTIGTVSTVSFLGGGMLTAGAAILFFTAPRAAAKVPPPSALGLRVGPGSIAIDGRF